MAGVLVGWLAVQKGRSFVGFAALAMVFSPLVGLLAVIAVPNLKDGSRQGAEPHAAIPTSQRKGSDFVLCLDCGRPRRLDSPSCQHCGAGPISIEEFEAKQEADAKSKSTELKKCPDCAELIQPEARKCRYCGSAQPAIELAS